MQRSAKEGVAVSFLGALGAEAAEWIPAVQAGVVDHGRLEFSVDGA
jgi:hypothetical protein